MKKHRTNRLLALLLVLVMTLSLFPVGAMAEEDAAEPAVPEAVVETDVPENEAAAASEEPAADASVSDEPAASDVETDAATVDEAAALPDEETDASAGTDPALEAGGEDDVPAVDEESGVPAEEEDEGVDLGESNGEALPEDMSEISAAGEELQAGPEIRSFSRTIINPLYADVVDEADIPTPRGLDRYRSSLREYAAAKGESQNTRSGTSFCKTLTEASASMRAQLVARSEQISVYYAMPASADINEVFDAIFGGAFTHTGSPREGDYLEFQWGGCSGGVEYVDADENTYYCCFIFSFLYYTTAAQEAEMDSRVNSILNSLSLEGKTEYSRLRAIYDYLCSHVEYDYANLNDDEYKLKYTGYAALVNNTAVCQGISVAFYRLALQAGLDARVISSDAMCHAWNIARCEDAYYELDATWDLGCSPSQYYYFLKGSTYWLREHTYNGFSTIGDQFTEGDFGSYYLLPATDYVPGETNLDTPVLLTAVNANGGVWVEWNAVSMAKRYRVFRKTGTGSWTAIADTTETSWLDITAVSGTKYAYTVRCVTEDGALYASGYDKTGKSVTYIAVPAVTSLASTNTGVTVKWSAPKGAENYRVFRRTDTSDWTKLGDTTGTSFTDKTAATGTTYYYSVRCMNKAASAFTSGFDDIGWSVTYIAAPVLVSAANDIGGVTVKWGSVDGAELYRVFRKTGTGSWKSIGDTAETSYTDTTAASGTKYSYTVRCVSADGSTYMSGYNTTGKSVTYVGAPVVTSLTSVNGGVQIKWTASTGAGKYRVFRRTETGSWAKVGDATAASYTDKTAVAGTTYYYTVRCMNSTAKAYTSAYDETGWSTTYIAAPVLVSAANDVGGVTVKWNASAGAELYRVFRKTGSGSWKSIADTTETSFTDTAAASGTKYTYTVRCVSADGSAYVSGYNTTGKGVTYIAAPVVTGVSSVSGGVKIQWAKSTGAAKYRVFRRTETGSWTKLGDTTATSYTDKTAAAGTTYYYTVRCMNSTAKAYTSAYDPIGTPGSRG